MLAYGEHKGVVHNQVATLGLCDVEIMALRVRRRVSCQECVRRILAGMSYRQCKAESVRIRLDGVLFKLVNSSKLQAVVLHSPSSPVSRHRSSAHLSPRLLEALP